MPFYPIFQFCLPRITIPCYLKSYNILFSPYSLLALVAGPYQRSSWCQVEKLSSLGHGSLLKLTFQGMEAIGVLRNISLFLTTFHSQNMKAYHKVFYLENWKSIIALSISKIFWFTNDPQVMVYW